MGRKAVVVGTLIVGFFAALWADRYAPAFMDAFCEEDHTVENTQAILLLASSLLCLSGLARRRWRNLWYAGFAALFFLNFGEEISWGQRIFGVATPAKLESVNVQGELNLHNINGITQHIRMAGMAVMLVLTVVIPLTRLYSPKAAELYRRFALPVFPAWTLWITALAMALMAVPRALHLPTFNLDEVGELYTYLSFLVFSLSARAQALELPAAQLATLLPVRAGTT